VLGGDVIRGFVFAMIWGVIVGHLFKPSSVFVA
jgi:preprotein translocase subunit SecF